MTAGDIIAEPIRIFKKKWLLVASTEEITDRVEQLMEKVGSPLLQKPLPHEFSGGQRQRIGIARALALNLKSFLCDEPYRRSTFRFSRRFSICSRICRMSSGAYLFIAHDLPLSSTFDQSRGDVWA
jgi:ABC-type oligopeptide transport system ATPase subunit